MENLVVDNYGQVWKTSVADNTSVNINTKANYLQVINMMEVKIKKLDIDAKLPTRGSAAAAGYDLYALLPNNIRDFGLQINPHETALIPTGLSFALPNGTFLGLYPRSGLASKRGLRPANCVGIVDSDYRGEVMVALHNDSNQPQYIENGERIAQAILQSYLPMSFEEVDELDSTERGINGFGSTGNK